MECLLRKTWNLYFVNFTSKLNNFHTSRYTNGWRQSGNAMKKVMGGTRKKKLHFGDVPKIASSNIFSKGSFDTKSSGNPKRVTVLNKLFMRHITDQLATGNCAEEILGHGVEIYRVKVTPDYKLVKVYWLAKGTSDDEVVEKILQKNAGVLRHELSQLRLMGVIPVIEFVKDKQYAKVVELDNRLAIADFGEDHTPLDPGEKLKTEFQIISPLSDNIKQKLKELDKTEIDDYEELPLPPMAQNVLGLNHADIFERIKRSKKKSEAVHRRNPTEENIESWVTFKVNQPINEDPVQLGDINSQREAFREFLQNRQILRMKSQRNKNYAPDMKFIKEELHRQHMENLNKFDIPENFDEDFIENEEEL